MKLIPTLFVLSFTLNLLAQDYEIARFEANDYRTFTMDEMKQLIGDAHELLPKLKCNGRDEFDPFQAPHRMNPLRNSLKVQAADGSQLTYMLGRFYNSRGEIVTSFSDPFQKKVASAFLRFEKIEPAVKLLRFLEESYFPLTMIAGRNRFSPELQAETYRTGIQMAQAIAFFTTLRMSPGVPFSDIGVGGKIFWKPKLVVTTIEEDGVLRKLDPDVALAHEMYHAFDSIRGKLDMGNVHGKDYEFTNILEYRGVYFENQVRKHFGIKLRKYYGDPQSLEAPGVLNAQGEPILIPAPCLSTES